MGNAPLSEPFRWQTSSLFSLSGQIRRTHMAHIDWGHKDISDFPRGLRLARQTDLTHNSILQTRLVFWKSPSWHISYIIQRSPSAVVWDTIELLSILYTEDTLSNLKLSAYVRIVKQIAISWKILFGLFKSSSALTYNRDTQFIGSDENHYSTKVPGPQMNNSTHFCSLLVLLCMPSCGCARVCMIILSVCCACVWLSILSLHDVSQDFLHNIFFPQNFLRLRIWPQSIDPGSKGRLDNFLMRLLNLNLIPVI